MKKDLISFDQFAALDVRVGEIVSCEKVDGSEKLLISTVDLGADYGTVSILSGIAQWFSPDDLKGKKTAFLANLQPRPMMGHTSQGMMMLVDSEDDGTSPTLIEISSEVENGSVVR